MNGPGTLILSGGNSYGGNTTLSGGNLQATTTLSAIDNTLVFAGGTLTLAVSGQQIYPNPLSILTGGTLVSAGGNNNVLGGAWSGNGTLNLGVASGTFTINANMTTNFTGTILFTDASAGTFRFNSGGNGTSTQQSSGSPNRHL